MDLAIGSTTRPYNMLSYQEAFGRLARAGYTDVAVFAHDRAMPVDSESSKAQVGEVRKAAADVGLNPSMLLARSKLDLGVEGAVEDFKRLIDNCVEMGGKWLLELGTGKEEFFETYFQVMTQVSPYAESAGIGISMKPHGGISLTTEHLLKAMERVNHPSFRVSYDPGNIIFYTKGEMRPETDIAEVAPFVSTGIIKDCTVEGDKADVMVTAGDGLVEFYTILSGLVGGGFSGPLYVECVGSAEPEGVDRDLAFTLGYVRGILSGM